MMNREKKSALTLIVDGNWLLMSRLAVLCGKYEDPVEMSKEVNSLMMMSLNVVLRMFRSIDNMIFVTDGGSWRNDLPVPEFMKDTAYKGNREKSAGIDWDEIFRGFSKFTGALRDAGITVCSEPGIEGDDWCWYWSRKLNSVGTDVMIWSRDRDLTQLVRRDKDGCFTLCWNKEGGATVEDKDEDEMDFFFNPAYSANEMLYNEIVSKSKAVMKIRPIEVVIDKIIRGDAGDNVLPVIWKKSSGTAQRIYKVPYKMLDMDLDITELESIEAAMMSVLGSKVFAGKTEVTLEQAVEHFIYNRKLVWLDERSYPEEILLAMDTHSDYNACCDITEAVQEVNAQKHQVDSLLESV